MTYPLFDQGMNVPEIEIHKCVPQQYSLWMIITIIVLYVGIDCLSDS